MRVFPVLLAIVVGTIVSYWVLDREGFYARLGFAPADVVEQTAVVEDDGVSSDGLIKVLAQRSTAQVIDSAVILRGQTQAVRQVDVRSETSSTVISDPIRKGSFVEKGQPMCVLDAGTRGASLAEARARLSEAIARKAEAETGASESASRVPEAAARVAEAEARLEEALANENVSVKLSEEGFASDTRVKNSRAAVAAARASVAAAQAGVEAAQSGLSGSQSGIQSAEAGIESAEASVAAAMKEIERLTIKAPFSGLLESDTAELGAFLQPGGLCGTIIQLNPIKLVAYVAETEVDKVNPGALAGAELAGSRGERVQGNVTFLSRSADPTTRTFLVEIEVPNPDLEIRDGQTAEILIAADGEEAHLLPASALTLNDEGTLGVRTVTQDNTVAFNPVSVLRDTQNGVWLAGLPAEANVIVVGQEYVTAGVEVVATFRENGT